MKSLKLFLVAALLWTPLLAAEQYLSEASFVANAFKTPPRPKSLWLTPTIKPIVQQLLQHTPTFLRTRYWQEQQRTVWILEEVGKNEPITVGVIIDNHKIVQLQVLAFRESRGWEVKHSFFTDQFITSTLSTEQTLSQSIDGISGATLSVNALTKIAQLALFFDQTISK
jgi:hypothetical protein